MVTSPAPRRWSLGRIAPAILVLFALTDLGMRLIPLDVFAFRAWETLVTSHVPTGPFAADRHYVNPRSYGDLVSLGRRMDLRQFRPERFTTDAYGYRNAAEMSHADVIVIGDSFGAGCGSNDDETLASQLGAISGKAVYNAAGPSALHLPDVRAVASRLHLTRGTVVYEYMERINVPTAASAETSIYRDVAPGAVSFEARARSLFRDLEVSRLEILVGREWSALVPYGRGDAAVVYHPLQNGAPMLFLRGDVDLFEDRRRRRELPADLTLGWERMARELADDGLELVVLLVPTKYVVYGPLLATPARDPADGVPYVDQIESRLRARGIAVVNVTEALAKEAANGLAAKRYVYWQDDSHWNAAGVAIAAGELARALRETSSP